MSSPHRLVVAIAAVLTAAAGARAQPPAAEPAAIRGDLSQTRKRLSEAEQKVLSGDAAAAVEDLQRILDEAGNDLVTIDGKQYRAARSYAHQILAKLPPDFLKAYQARIDEPARKLLDAGKRDRSIRPLRELLERYFVSRPAQEGLLLLGDLLFERGEFRAAEQQWRRLLPNAGADLHYPLAPPDAAAIRARLILAAIFQNDLDRARDALAEFKKQHPNATGALAARTGPYAAMLQGYLDHPPRLPPPAGGEKTWPTFGGDPERSGRAGGPMPYHWPPRPTWIAEIPAEDGAERKGPPVQPPFGHPVIADGRMFISDGRRIFSFDLKTGERKIVLAPLPKFLVPDAAAARTSEPDACTSLTFASGRLYARLGPPAVQPPGPGKAGAPPSSETAIACFGPVSEQGEKASRYRELWRIAPPPADGKPPAVWEGAPLVANRRMWAALARFDGGRVVHSIACYDPADSGTVPERPAWVAEVCDSPMSSGSESRTRQELLTLAGPNVVFCSNTGAVVALDASTGQRRWAFSYPRTARRLAEANGSPDPAPAVYAGGRVFVAPADSDRVYAFDAETGELVWESGLTEGAQIVGVSRDRLIVTVSGQVRGIRALGVRTGSHRPPDGWVQHSSGASLTYGRGLVTDNVIVWPSHSGLLFLHPETGGQRFILRTMPSALDDWYFGNVAYADGVMVVVTPTQVWGYNAIAPVYPDPKVPPADPRAAFEAMIDTAEAELAEGNETKARETLIASMRAGFPASWRAWAAARLLLLTSPTDGAEGLPQVLRDILDPALAREWLLTADGRFVTLGSLLDQHTGREPARRPVFPASPVPAAERRPENVPGLAATARVDRFVRLPSAATPLITIPGAARPRNFFAASIHEVTAFPLDAGKASRYLSADIFAHAADLGDGFVAAGPFAVAVYGSDREPAWVFRVPDTDPLPDRPGDRIFRGGEPIPLPQMSSFVLQGSWLFARLGDRHLVAFDLESRNVAWLLGANGRACFEPLVFTSEPRFEPHFLVAGRLLVVQLSSGRRWMIDAATGRVQTQRTHNSTGDRSDDRGQPTAMVPWVHPPVELDDNRFAFADGTGLVRLLDLDTDRVKWTYAVEGESSLAGESPQVRRWGEAILVAVRRNYGVELDRIDSFDGSSVWRGPVFIDAARVNLGSADADFTQVYVPAEGKIVAHSLEDGKQVWETELPKSREAIPWVVRAGRRVVIVYPSRSIAADPMSAVFDRATSSFARLPLVWRLPWLATTLYDSWTSRTLPVLLLDPETGEILKKLAVPARGPYVSAYFEGDRAVIATGDRVVWLR